MSSTTMPSPPRNLLELRKLYVARGRLKDALAELKQQQEARATHAAHLEERVSEDEALAATLDETATELQKIEKKIQAVAKTVPSSLAQVAPPKAYRTKELWVRFYVGEELTIGQIMDWHDDSPLVSVRYRYKNSDDEWDLTYGEFHWQLLELPLAQTKGSGFGGYRVGERIRIPYTLQEKDAHIVAIFNGGDIVARYPGKAELVYRRAGMYRRNRLRVVIEACKRIMKYHLK